jgi:hypothetical protein
MVSEIKRCRYLLWLLTLPILLLLSGSCHFWLDKPLANPDTTALGARSLAEVYETLASLALQYPDTIELDTIGFAASPDFPVAGTAGYSEGENVGYIAADIEGDPDLPIRLVVWREPAAQQPDWGLIPIRITAAIHGNEELGTELVLALLEKACRENPPELAGLELHVVPVANPYGYLHSTRHNYQGVDLNRNFSWAWGYESAQGVVPLDQTESRALAIHAATVPFVLSLSLHTGAYRIVMPWDYIGTTSSLSLGKPSYPAELYLSLYSPAHDFLQAKASLFAWSVEDSFPEMGNFPVSQGFDWYFAGGTETDYLYMELGVPAYTVELSPNKYWKTRTGAEREVLVEGHLKALLAMLAESRQGIHGKILGEFDFGMEARVNAVRVLDDAGGSRSMSGPEPVPYTSFGLVSASDASFHIPLGAGMYQLTVVRDGVELAGCSVIVEPGAGTYVEIGIVAP